MKKRNILILMIVGLMLVACASKAAMPFNADTSVEMLAPAIGGAPNTSRTMAEGAPALEGNSQSAADSSSAQLQERLVMMDVNLSIIVANPQTKMESIEQMATNMGGFVVSSNLYQNFSARGEAVPEASISIRVPSEQLNSALTQIKTDVVETRNETRTGQDVTQEYVDLESRLRSLEAAVTRLQELMEASDNTQDVLEVFAQWEYYREQVEQVKGQMQYYENASTYSLINVTIIAEETIKPIEIGGWKPEGIARDAIQALINFLQGITDFLIRFFLYYLWVLVIIFGPWVALAFGIRAAVLKRKAKKAGKEVK